MSRLSRFASLRKNAAYTRYLVVVVAAAMGVGLSGCGANSAKTPAAGPTASATADVNGVTSALDKNEIVIGFDNTFVPMGFDDQGVTKGFDVDLANAWSKETGKKIRFQNIDWNLKETEINSGKIDAIWNGYSYSDERAKKVGMSDPYMRNKQIIMVIANSPVQAKTDLAGKTVAVQAGSTGAEAVANDKAFLSSIQGGQPVAYDTFDKALRDLEVGRVNAVVGDSVLLNYYAKQKGADKFRVLGQDFGEESFVVATRKNDTKFLESINDFLKKAKADGTIQTITTTWFKQ